MKKIICVLFLLNVSYLICFGISLDGTYFRVDLQQNRDLIRYDFSSDGKFIFIYKSPDLFDPEINSIELLRKGTYQIDAEIIEFTVIEEAWFIAGEKQITELPYTTIYKILFRNENTLEMKTL